VLINMGNVGTRRVTRALIRTGKRDFAAGEGRREVRAPARAATSYVRACLSQGYIDRGGYRETAEECRARQVRVGAATKYARRRIQQKGWSWVGCGYRAGYRNVAAGLGGGHRDVAGENGQGVGGGAFVVACRSRKTSDMKEAPMKRTMKTTKKVRLVEKGSTMLGFTLMEVRATRSILFGTCSDRGLGGARSLC